MINKHYVQLVDTTYGYGQSGNSEPIQCGSLTQEEIETYIKQLSANKVLPMGTCVHHMSARFYNTDKVYTYLVQDQPNTGVPSEEHNSWFEIGIGNTAGQKCSKYDCFNNIKHGKCTDPFVIETIGKKFFADKYNNEQTKQR